MASLAETESEYSSEDEVEIPTEVVRPSSSKATVAATSVTSSAGSVNKRSINNSSISSQGIAGALASKINMAATVVASKTGIVRANGRITVSKPKKASGAVNNKMMSVETAERIWSEALDRYKAAGQYADTDADGREAFKWLIAEMFVAGTSRETDFTNYSIEGKGATIRGEILVQVCNENYVHHNPIRPFFRSYNAGEFPQMMSILLTNPENTVLRGTQQLSYNCGENDLRYAFDLADALIIHKYVQPADNAVIVNLKNHALAQARFNATASGLVRPVQDSSQATRQTFAGSAPGTVSTATPSASGSRMAFASTSSLM